MARISEAKRCKIYEGILAGRKKSDIAKTANVEEDIVQEYIDKVNTSAKISTITSVADKSQDIEKAETIYENENDYGISLSEDVVLGAIQQLKSSGIEEIDASLAIRKIHANIRQKIDKPDELASLCMQVLSVHNTMVTKAAGGQKGIAVMTSAASELMDSQKRKSALPDRGCIFKPKG